MFGKTTFRSLLDSDKKSLDEYFANAEFFIGKKLKMTDENTTNFVLLSDDGGVIATMSMRIGVTSHLKSLSKSFLVTSLSLRNDFRTPAYFNCLLLYAWNKAKDMGAKYLYFYCENPLELEKDFCPAAHLGLYAFYKPEDHLKDLYVKSGAPEGVLNPGFMTAL